MSGRAPAAGVPSQALQQLFTIAMCTAEYVRLTSEFRPLLSKFYRAQRSHMRAPHEAQYWVARKHDIVAALCLTPVADGFWLTGLLVEPAQRGQGQGSRLVRHVLMATQAPVWLFCHPHLQPFYERLGFTTSNNLPIPLADRLTRYRRTKTLIAMKSARSPTATATSSGSTVRKADTSPLTETGE